MEAQTEARPVLVGRHVRIRPGHPADAPRLQAILAEPSVSRWWGEPAPVAAIETDLRGGDSAVLLVMEIDGQVAGGIQYEEENEPMYRFLFEQRGHHRITIDPATANLPAIRCYTKVGFRPVGVMRQHERGGDGQFHDGLLMDLLRDELALQT
jgi:aminoglycoside 6'-N-acetyltransferase